MDMMINQIPADPALVDLIFCELRSQGIFDTFRKECIADVDTKPAYQNLRQRVQGSVSSFLKAHPWTGHRNKNQLREKLRRNISESAYLEPGVERIVDQVVNPKINAVFLPKVIDIVYTYLGLEKPDPKIEKEGKEDAKVKSEELLPEELEAVSPESHEDDQNDESGATQEDSKVEDDESPPFEPLGDDNSMDSHLSGISALQSHDSNQSVKGLLIDESQISKNSSDESNGQSIEKIDKNPVSKVDEDHMDTKEEANSSESIDKDVKGDCKSSKSERDKSERRHDRNKFKYSDRERSGENERDKYRSDKERNRSSSSRSRRDDKREKDRRDRDKERERNREYKSSSSSKSREDKCRTKHDGHKDKRSSSYRSEKSEKEERKEKSKEKKDDHYSCKNKATRRSTDRDSNDGSGLKSSSSSICESNNSSQNSRSNSQTNKGSADSNLSGNSDSNESKQSKEKTVQSLSVSAASWDALEAQLNSNVNNDLNCQLEGEDVEYFNEQTTQIEEENHVDTSNACIKQITRQIEYLEGSVIPSLINGDLDGKDTNKENKKRVTKRKNNAMKKGGKAKMSKLDNCAKKSSNIANIPLPFGSPESDYDSDNADEMNSEVSNVKAARKNVNQTQRYSSEDLYKPRPNFKRTTSRLRGMDLISYADFK